MGMCICRRLLRVEDLEDVHGLFKDFVVEHRPSLNIDEVATGEAWFGRRALERNLVDELKTSDEYLVDKCEEMDVFQVRYLQHKHKLERLIDKMSKIWTPPKFGYGLAEENFG